jgi:hypothetical protein
VPRSKHRHHLTTVGNVCISRPRDRIASAIF